MKVKWRIQLLLLLEETAELLMKPCTVLLGLARAAMFVMLGIAAMTYAQKAAATEVAYAPTEAGGQIILTDQRGKCEADSYISLLRAPGGSFLTGCWTISDSERYIIVLWSDGDSRMYLATSFIMFQGSTIPELKEYR